MPGVPSAADGWLPFDRFDNYYAISNVRICHEAESTRLYEGQRGGSCRCRGRCQCPTLAANLITSTDKTAIHWDKAPCRFCGTGCSVLVGSQDGRVVATQGDPDAPVNRGLNCIKGYFLSKIMYGQDRLTQPMLRMKNGQFDKDGDFAPSAGIRRSTSWPRSSRRP